MSLPSRTATFVLCAVTSLFASGRAEAQQPPAPPPPENRPGKVAPEVRLDAIIATLSALHAGAGFTTAAGTYVRTGAVAGVGFSRDGLSGRLDGMARFHFDPFRQSRWAPYGGGGLSGRFDRGEKARAYLMLLLGLDGPDYSGATPSFELGLGGGTRIGVIVRRATAERR
ncbi:MAG TPA: hypothetical protein VES88_08050 [Gemmatimonadaceae bacterium]|nr:hypothetical protein [Gemmatimonadaceae bacterium]